VLAKAKLKGQGIACLNNTRQFALGWIMYGTENDDRLVKGNPVAGGMGWLASSYDNTNSAVLVDKEKSPMATYVRSHAVYKCPADNYVKSGVPSPRVRSLAMNAALLGVSITIENQIPGRTYFSATKMSQLVKPGASMVFVALDEHPDSINDSTF